jgi:hypothetical protein
MEMHTQALSGARVVDGRMMHEGHLLATHLVSYVPKGGCGNAHACTMRSRVSRCGNAHVSCGNAHVSGTYTHSHRDVRDFTPYVQERACIWGTE